MTLDTNDFDVSALITICARWPSLAVPSRLAVDPLLERLRQILSRVREGSLVETAGDLVPLVRQVLLRLGDEGAALPWLKVPVANGWPTTIQWSDAQFELIDDGAWAQVRPRLPRLSFLLDQPDLFDDAFLGVVSRAPSQVAGDPLLERSLDLRTYTGDGQREAIRALLHLPPNETLIANLPTGSGKSLLAQLPPLLEMEGTLTLAVVPTVALAIDQAARMRRFLIRRFPNADLPPLAYHGGLSDDERRVVWRSIRNGSQPVIFTSPEHATGTLRQILQESAEQGRLTHVVIDEAHLVIGWGNGFRPAFQLLPALVGALRQHAGSRPIRVALASATLTAVTTDALRRLFGPPERAYVVAAVHLRPEPRYGFVRCDDSHGQRSRVLEAVRLAPRPFILYVTRPDEADRWLHVLHEAGLRRVAKFTGNTAPSERESLLQAWGENRLDGMVATSAFGLGVDKGDVRTVLHATLPESLDRFYQEVGRSGRDGRAGASLLLFTAADIDQAKGMAGDRLIRDETGYERWTLLIDHARPDSHLKGVYWVELGRLPPHLKVRSEASTLWNVRTLTLMARAGLIELIALSARGSGKSDETPQDISVATHAAVRILDDGHRTPGHFAARMQKARLEGWDASERGVRAMEAVASGGIEVSEALRKTYSIHQGIWAPVTQCCGGCPQHWSQRRESVRYRPPRATRLQRFSDRPLDVIERLAVPRATSNLLVVDAHADGRYGALCGALVEALSSSVRPHTWVLEKHFALRHLKIVRASLAKVTDDRSFIDIIDATHPDEWNAGDAEVRVTFWSDQDPPPPPEALWLSDARMEILIVPSDLRHPRQPGRRFIDTTPHVHATDLLDLITV